MIKTYVKKLCSLHPNKYRYLELNEALKKHHQYQMKYGEAYYFKKFEEWLKTEI